MLEHTKHQVHKRKFLQHVSSRYVYNCSLFVSLPLVIRVSIDLLTDNHWELKSTSYYLPSQ